MTWQVLMQYLCNVFDKLPITGGHYFQLIFNQVNLVSPDHVCKFYVFLFCSILTRVRVVGVHRYVWYVYTSNKIARRKSSRANSNWAPRGSAYSRANKQLNELSAACLWVINSENARCERHVRSIGVFGILCWTVINSSRQRIYFQSEAFFCGIGVFFLIFVCSNNI